MNLRMWYNLVTDINSAKSNFNQSRVFIQPTPQNRPFELKGYMADRPTTLPSSM